MGFKILLDLLASSPRPLKVAEVPYTFRDRVHGESKLDNLVIWEYGMLLADNWWGASSRCDSSHLPSLAGWGCLCTGWCCRSPSKG